ncbi:MAG TPA: type II secretion system protein GspN [Candidatus Kryptonia bacterium]|nr:type II secretion system protein GspN [Candidatus Kryptonia bacterium]
MRWPRLRLSLRPRLPQLSFEWLGDWVSRTVVLYSAYTVVLFLVFMLINFPHDVIVRRVISQIDLGQLQIEFASANFAWLNGYELRGLKLSLPTGASERVSVVEASTLDVRPALASLIKGQLNSWQWRSELYGGTVTGDWVINHATGAGGGQLVLNKIEIGRHRALTAQLDEGQLTGQLSGTVSVQATPRDARATQVSGDITIARPALTGAKIKGFKVPDVQFSLAKGKFTFKGDRLDLQDVKLSGDQLNASVSGQINFRQPVSASTLNLRATFESSPATPDQIKVLLALIPRAPNARPEAPITITGTLGAPQVK